MSLLSDNLSIAASKAGVASVTLALIPGAGNMFTRRKQITKGMFINYDRPSERREFMFNPNQYTDSKGAEYGSDSAPRHSHPAYQYGHGGERSIKLTVHLDGDRGTIHRPKLNRLKVMDISNEIRWYRSFLYPDRPVMPNPFTGTKVSPPRVSFILGPFSVVGHMSQCEVTVTQFYSDMTPWIADLNIELIERVDTVVYRDQIWNDITGNF